MHDTDANSPSMQSGQLHGKMEERMPSAALQLAVHAAVVPDKKGKKIGWIKRIILFFSYLFKGRPLNSKLAVDSGFHHTETAHTIKTVPPLVFKGDTTQILVTPMGAYAGKPARLVMRRHAEQQFQDLDISRTTMN